MDLARGIIATAQAIGADPLDLATVISYETAGTFDPKKAGPTTQWGQHRGLIQFGEPQARQHGVDWNDPVGSQLGPNGAVASYFKASGYKPGMGLLDLYSTVNAGAPGRYNASDANNGGAPGTVADKVNDQMAGHRQKAAQLLGQTAPATVSTKGQPMGGLMGMLGNQQQQPAQGQPAPEMAGGLLGRMFPNMTADKRDQLAINLAGMSTRPNVGLMRNLQGQIENRAGTAAEQRKMQQAQEMQAQQQQEEARRKAMALKWIIPNLGEEVAQGYMNNVFDNSDIAALWKEKQGGGVEGKDRFMNVDGVLYDVTGERPTPVTEKSADEATTAVQTLEQRAERAGLVKGTQEYAQFMINGGAERGMSLRVGADGSVSFTQGKADDDQDVTNPSSPGAMISSIDGILNDPALDFATGWLEWTQNIPGTESRRFGARVKQLNGQAFLQAFESLKGGGHITEIEGQKATEAVGRLDSAQRPEDYRAALGELKSILQLGMERKKAGGAVTSDRPGVQSIELNGTTYQIEEVQ